MEIKVSSSTRENAFEKNRTGRQPRNSSLDGFGNRVLVITFCASATTVIDPLSELKRLA